MGKVSLPARTRSRKGSWEGKDGWRDEKDESLPNREQKMEKEDADLERVAHSSFDGSKSG